MEKVLARIDKVRVEPIKELNKILTTLAMLSIIFCALIMPAQAEQSDVVEPPTANFSAFFTSGEAPFDAAFMDTSTGDPAEWYWEFGDGETSTQQDPTHTYSEPGSYTVILTVTNDAGSDVVTKAGYITVNESIKDTQTSANKSVSLSYLQLAATYDPARPQGETTPEAVDSVKIVEAALAEEGLLNDTYAYDGSYGTETIKAYKKWQESIGSAERYCDGIPGEKDLTKLGNKYEFTVDNSTISNSEFEPEENTTKLDVPVADFSTSVTGGYAPLSVAFIDLSQNATSRSWDVNDDGIEDSTEASFTYEYASAGTYTVKLKAINTIGTDEKTATISVERRSSGGSSEDGGGGGGSPEPAKNVGAKELAQVFISNGKVVQFDFTKNATCVVCVGFDAKKTVGKTTTIVEQLKNKSALVSELPEGEVYKYFNVWVGNSGYATSDNIDNPGICFKVEKSWLQDENIGQDSIVLNRYSNKTWEQLPATLLREDSEYLYFTADVSEYSFFAVTGKSSNFPEETVTPTEEVTPTKEVTPTESKTKSPGAVESFVGSIVSSTISSVLATFLTMGILGYYGYEYVKKKDDKK